MLRDRSVFLYMEPSGDGEGFAQCATCPTWIKPTERCKWFSAEDEALKDDTCGLYVEGPPITTAEQPIGACTPKEAGYYRGQVRCENCASFTSASLKCRFYVLLNKTFPKIFKLNENVKAKACCNAFVPS